MVFLRLKAIYTEDKFVRLSTKLPFYRIEVCYNEYFTLSDINKENIWLLYKVTLSSNLNEGIITFCETFRDKLSYDDLTKISHDYINKYLEENNMHIIICLEYLYRYFDFDKSKYELMGIFQ